MLINLNNTYAKYDFVNKIEIKLQNFKYFINVKKKNKIFDKFFKRFHIIIIFLDFIE